MSERDNAINRLTATINKHHDSQLTTSQVDHWVGSDASVTSIIDDCNEVNQSCGNYGVNPDDVLSLCDEMD